MLIFKALGVNSLTAFKWTARDSSYFNIEPFAGVANAEAAYPIQSTIESGQTKASARIGPPPRIHGTSNPWI